MFQKILFFQKSPIREENFNLDNNLFNINYLQ